jgi:hypothetical protein
LGRINRWGRGAGGGVRGTPLLTRWWLHSIVQAGTSLWAYKTQNQAEVRARFRSRLHKYERGRCADCVGMGICHSCGGGVMRLYREMGEPVEKQKRNWINEKRMTSGVPGGLPLRFTSHSPPLPPSPARSPTRHGSVTRCWALTGTVTHLPAGGNETILNHIKGVSTSYVTCKEWFYSPIMNGPRAEPAARWRRTRTGESGPKTPCLSG